MQKTVKLETPAEFSARMYLAVKSPRLVEFSSLLHTGDTFQAIAPAANLVTVASLLK